MKRKSESADMRLNKNLSVIRTLMLQLEKKLNEYEALEKVNYGHVGDLSHIRGCLYEALGYENNPDPA